MKENMPRRDFLKASLCGTGLTLAAGMGGFANQSSAETEKVAADPSGSCHLNIWIRVSQDNAVTVLVPKSEMGQGVHTALAMIVADELEAAWQDIRVEAAPTRDEYCDPVFETQLTGGSTSVRHMFSPLRKAAAAAREMLLAAAAEQWKVPAAQCTASAGSVKHVPTGRVLKYGELCTRAAGIQVPQDPPLKNNAAFKIIGNSTPRLDVPAKVNGTAVFGMDVSFPGMVYAAVVKPPRFGAELVSYEDATTSLGTGVHDVVRVGESVAVCADSFHSALEARESLKAKWDGGTQTDLDTSGLEKLLSEGLSQPGVTARNDGDVTAALESASRVITARYELPYLAHAALEPKNCTAFVQKDRCDVWCSTQYQSAVVGVAVKETGLSKDHVYVHTTFVGGGFGGRTEVEVERDAIRVSKAIGKPVKLIWTREDDFAHDFYRPGSCCLVRGGLDAVGNLVAWSHKVAVQSIVKRVFPGMIQLGIDPSAVEGIFDTEYAIRNFRVEQVLVDTPVPVGFWRSVGHSGNAFAVESFVDELAHAAGKDPLEFRLNMLKKRPGAYRVLQRVAEMAGWNGPLSRGTGRGLARHYSFGTHVALVAEVSVDRQTGMIKVERFVCVVDCGPVVNPDNVVAQMEGAILMGLSAALKEKVEFAQGGVQSLNYDDYELLTMSRAPRIEVYIMQSGEKQGGIGEPGLPPVAPALANAVFAATGARFRRLPISPADVRQALGAS